MMTWYMPGRVRPMPCAYIPIVVWHEFTLKSEHFSHERVCLCWRWSVREISGGCHNSCPFICTTLFAYGAQNVNDLRGRTRFRLYSCSGAVFLRISGLLPLLHLRPIRIYFSALAFVSMHIGVQIYKFPPRLECMHA